MNKFNAFGDSKPTKLYQKIFFKCKSHFGRLESRKLILILRVTNEILDHLSDSQSPRKKCCRRHCCYCHRVPLSCGVVCPHLNEVLCKHSAGEKRAVFMKSGLFTTHRVKCLASPELVYYYQAIWISSICLIHLLIKSSAGALRCSSLSTWSAKSPAVSLPLCLVGRLCLILRGQMRSDAAKAQTVHIC